MQLKIDNWKKFNPRGDVKRPSWFRMENGVFSDPQFFDFTGMELLAWIYLLAHASQKNSGEVTVVKSHVEMVGKVPWPEMLSAIKKLETLHCVHVLTRERDVDVTDSPATNERTNGTGRTDETDGGAQLALSPPPPQAAKAGPKKKTEPIGRATWEAYSKAYLQRHGTEPLRNARVSTQIAAFVKCVGEEAAPEVAKFYLSHSKAYYVTNQHPVSAMLKDAESLHTQWKTNRRVTGRDGRQAEGSDGFKNQLDRIQRGEL